MQVEEKSTRKFNATKSGAQGDKKFKKSLVLNEIKVVVLSRQDPTQQNFQLVKRNERKT